MARLPPLVLYVITLVTLLSNHVTPQAPPPPVTLTYAVFEEIPEGTPIGYLKEDAGFKERYTRTELSRLRFRFLMQPRIPVELEATTGSLVTNGRLDREEYCEAEETCEVSIDIAVQPIDYFQIVKITLVIEDENDNAPLFDEPDVSFHIMESAAVGTSLTLPGAFDRDSPSNGIRSYELQRGGDHFGLQVEAKADGSTALKLIIEHTLDREMQAQYHMTLAAFDLGDRMGTVDISVQILDANDNNPLFDNDRYEITVSENLPIGTSIIRVQAHDPDAGANGEIVYTFSQRTQERFGHILQLNPLSGDILISDVLDFEEHQILHVAIIAEDGGPNSLPAETIVIITVTDVNDNAPNVTINTLTGSDLAEITEEAPVGTFVAHFSVVDRDSGSNGIFDCFLRHSSFALSKLYASEYQVVTTTPLDRETKVAYDVSIECMDEGTPRLSTETYLNIIVTDVNDNIPEFEESFYELIIQENNAVGASLLQVRATDQDMGMNGEIVYSVAETTQLLFNIEPTSGRIFASKSYDREDYIDDRIEFKVVATDYGIPALSSSATVVITLLDMNDEAPLFLQEGYSFGVFENKLAGENVGQVAAIDSDDPPFNEIQFSIESISQDLYHFNIDPITGVIRTTQRLDREAAPMYHLTVIARDVGRPELSSSTSVSIYVSDDNDNDPIFDFPNVFNNTVKVPSNAPEAYAVSRIRAHDPDLGENAQLSYFITQGNEKEFFHLDPNYGVLTTMKDFSEMQYETMRLTILIRDKGEPARENKATLTVHIVEAAPALNAQSGGGGVLSSDNVTIVVSLAVISVAIMIVLVVAIILLYKRTQAKKTQYGQYNCRQEALRVWQHNGTRASDEHTLTNDMYGAMDGSTVLGSSTAVAAAANKKEVSFNLDPEFELERRPESQQSMRSTIDSHALRNPQAQSSALTAVTSGSTLGAIPSSCQSTISRQAEQRQLEVERLMDMLRRGEYETNSVISEEDSTTDSGRGPSEEGDHHARHLSNDSVNRLKTFQKLRVAKDSPDPQVVPSISNQTTPLSTQPKSLSLLPSHAANHLPHQGVHPNTVTSELAKLETRKERLESESTESVRSDCELLNEANKKNTQLECAIVRTATPDSTPMATWRKGEDYTPSTFYASYLDYKYPKSSQLSLPNKQSNDSPFKPSGEGISQGEQTRISPQRSTQCRLTTFSPPIASHNKHPTVSPQKPLNSQYQRTSPQKGINGEQHTVNSPSNKGPKSTNMRAERLPSIKDISPVKNVVTCPQLNHNNNNRCHLPLTIEHPQRANIEQESYFNETECTDNGLLYSCADMSDALALKMSGRQSVLDAEQTDNCSTTSGSYVVDPLELCDEIDKVFFNESEA